MNEQTTTQEQQILNELNLYNCSENYFKIPFSNIVYNLVFKQELNDLLQEVKLAGKYNEQEFNELTLMVQGILN